MAEEQVKKRKHSAKYYKRRRKRRIRRAITGLVLLLVLGAAGFWAVTHYVLVDGQLYRKGEGIDLSGQSVDVQHFEQLSEQYPEEEIVWDVPIGDGSYDSRSESIRVGAFGPEDLDKFALFENLRSVDGSGSPSYESLSALQAMRPELDVSWTVPLSDTESYPDDAEEAAVTGPASAAELQERLPYLPKLQRLDLTGAEFADPAEAETLAAAFPELRIHRLVTVCGQTLDNEAAELSFPGLEADRLPELTAAGPAFFGVERIDLGDGLYDAAAVAALRAAYKEAAVLCRLSFYGVETDSMAAELDLSKIPIEDTSGVDLAVASMAGLEKIIMSDCGIPDEEMDALNKKFDDVRVVWTVYIRGDYPCRTDSDNFIVRVGDHGGKIYNKDVACLQYCTDMVTLDLGHMEIDDLFFCRNMPHLRFLIIGDTWVSDLSPLQDCHELYYIEMFITRVSDLSPLLDKTELRHLNVSYSRPEDYDAFVDQICQLTWLERLGWMSSNLNGEQRDKVIAALPNTDVCFFYADPSSVNRWWRDSDSYREMRDNLDMPYHL